MLKKIIIIEDNNKIQCDSEEEIVRLLIDKNYYELTEKQKLEKREIKAMANCINNKKEIINSFEVDANELENKFIIVDEKTYILSLLMTNNLIILERIDSNIYTNKINKIGIDDNYIIVNKFAKELLKSYLQEIQGKK